MYYIDPVYIYFAIPGFFIVLIAQIYIKVVYNKYSKVQSGSNITGLDAAHIIKENEGYSVDIITTKGKLNDFFDPQKNIVNISSDNTHTDSIANIAVVAHEFGHVQQKELSTKLFKFRNMLIPIVSIGSQVGYVLFFLGLTLQFFNLAQLGLVLFGTTTVFALLSLPIEYDASKRAMRLIEKYDLISEERRYGAKEVLNAAAFTYFAGFMTSLLNLLYYTNLLGRRKN